MNEEEAHRLATVEARDKALQMALLMLFETLATTNPLEARKVLKRYLALGADAMPAIEGLAYEWACMGWADVADRAEKEWLAALRRASAPPRR